MKKVINSLLALAIVALSIFPFELITNAVENVLYNSSIIHTINTNKRKPDGLDGIYYFYFVIDSYDDYLILDQLGLANGKTKSYFDNNILLVVFANNVTGTAEDYVNESITKDQDTLCIDYSVTKEGIVSTEAVNYEIDYITMKKSDISNVNLKAIKANLKIKYLPVQTPGFEREYSEEDRVLDLKYIDIKRYEKKTDLVQTPPKKNVKKPSQVKKVKVKSVKKKQLKVSWKNIKGVKYEVKYSLKKGMKNAKTKKNIKKNKITLKRLKSGKKYYIKVRAYQKIGNKTYTGKWSKVVKKKTK